MSSNDKMSQLIACHDCDMLHHLPPAPSGGLTRCRRCGAILHRDRPNSLNRTLALSIAALILFTVANTFPFLAFKMQGQVTETTLITGVLDLYAQGMWGLAVLVFMTSILVPLLQIVGLLYVLLPLKFHQTAWRLPRVFRLLHNLQPWGMMEVFMLGILVAVVKLAGMATIVPGIALWSFALLIFVLASAAASLDPDIVWERVRWRP